MYKGMVEDSFFIKKFLAAIAHANATSILQSYISNYFAHTVAHHRILTFTYIVTPRTFGRSIRNPYIEHFSYGTHLFIIKFASFFF